MRFIIAILPIILIGLFIYKKDREKESSGLIFRLFLGGIGSCFPAVILELFVGSFFPETPDMNFFQLFLYVFFGIAFVEEVCKWFMVYKISYNHNEFDSLYDMIVYASFVALGFACFENILYVMDSGIVTGVMRAITAVPGHVCDGILMGSYLALAKFNHVKGNVSLSKKYFRMSIIVPFIMHGIYDYCLYLGYPIFVCIFIIFVITLFVICFKKIIDISKNDIKFVFKNKYCVRCGNMVNSNYCPRCGNKNN